MNEVKEIREVLTELWDKLIELSDEVKIIKLNTLPVQADQGTWEDLVEWLKVIPGSPRLHEKNSVNHYCGPKKLFKPGESYKIVNNRRVFIRSEVERVIREWAKIK
jgi:hypothetical protein